MTPDLRQISFNTNHGTSTMAASPGLMNGETFTIAAAVPMLVYHRPGRALSTPLVVFIPGGGHLARVSYGYPDGNPQDFLDHWLGEAGYGFLAPSVATGPHFPVSASCDVTRLQWADALSELIADATATAGQRRSVIILAWSMASNVVGPLAVALRKRGVDIEAFIPMAARPPLPSGSGDDRSMERVDDKGFWDVAGSPVSGVPRRLSWLAEIAAIEAELGRKVLPSKDYEKYVLVATPPALRHERGSPAASDDLDTLPMALPIAPTDQRDFRHALGDITGWAHMNAQIIVRRYASSYAAQGGSMDATSWTKLSSLVADLPKRLGATIDGGHFFFVGERGASATAATVIKLMARNQALQAELASLLGEPRTSVSTDG
ncbi:hypothetical protein [Mesorhizobium retamae]|uniref:Alpha/beta hydrolase n=1 Tax=Mesorhizobium retamae TaxID=2912854 RepID=A0ABS9QD52_9HYPH|nr:hypothetical protein [Mesorhizobium sp. IRAMC:0171]MCG7505342.1 hypothetical protein [Mesorhizobium sp. IRAMC:0171]